MSQNVYLGCWSFIFGDYPEAKFDCTLTSKFSMKLQWNLSWRGCKINFRTSRFWNCNCFLDLIMISWRNHCLENVNLQGRRGKTPSFVPLDLDFTVYSASRLLSSRRVWACSIVSENFFQQKIDWFTRKAVSLMYLTVLPSGWLLIIVTALH